MLDDNGTLLWSSGLGHSDKAYLSDIDPRRPGMEVFLAIEPFEETGYGVSVLDAATGERIWGIGHKTYHVGDRMVADIDPTPGLECFASEDQKVVLPTKYIQLRWAKIASMTMYPLSQLDLVGCRLHQTNVFGDDNRWGSDSRSGDKGKKSDTGKEKIAHEIWGYHHDCRLDGRLAGRGGHSLPGVASIYRSAADRKIALMQDPFTGAMCCNAHRVIHKHLFPDSTWENKMNTGIRSFSGINNATYNSNQ